LAGKLKVGLVGVAHPHVWSILKALQGSDLGTLSAVSIEPTLSGERARIVGEYGLKRTYGDYREMLDEEDVDVVFNYADHVLRAPVTEYAAGKSLHVMVEKPMAYNLRDAGRMYEVAYEQGVKLMVNWPTMWSAAYRKAHELVSGGKIGNVFHVRTRIGHNSCEKGNFIGSCFQWMGQKEAGGAYLDFCCYGVALSIWLIGMPKRVFGTAGNFVKAFIPSYDNGIVIMMYDNGTASIEGTWSQIGDLPGDPMIYGTEGTISLGSDEARIFTRDKVEGELVRTDPLPRGEGNAVEHFLTCVKEDRPIGGMCDPKLSRNAQEVLEAGLMSSMSGEVVTIPISKRGRGDITPQGHRSEAL
jgi:predicted dehydrogenase